MSITIVDVARAAGVSRTTVSNVFGGKDKCSEETRDAVLAAAKKLGYQPNLAARSLITRRSRLIGLILPSYVDTNTLTNSPFYNIIMDSVYSVLRDEAYYDLIIFSVPYKSKLEQVSEWIDARNVDGILAIGEYDQSFLQELNSKGIPVVFIDNYTHDNYINFSGVVSDDEVGGYLATQHLISKRYKKIALCAVGLASPLMQKRCDGYKKAMKEAGLKDFELDGLGIPFEAGLKFADLLASQNFDAVFCNEDMVAVGILHGMLKKGVQVGKDFGLVGFDNIHIGQQVFPELTTIDQNIYEKGETATKMLLMILEKHGSLGSHMVLPVKLVVRDTA
jgi:DNA-binding LacI/PurR family transcriptional regulator